MPMIKTTFRAGVAMVELIFAIVIMGITLLSIPNIIETGVKTSIVAFQQEAIAITASHTSALMTYAWDEQNTDSKLLYTKEILHTSTTTAALTETGRDAFTFPTRKRTFVPGGIASANLGRATDGNATVADSNDDVDDFIVNTLDLVTIVGGGNTIDEGEYYDVNISLNTQVTYGDDDATYDSSTGIFAFSSPFTAAAPAGTSFIKLITVDLNSSSTSSELNKKLIKLKAFMCNIGAANPLSRSGI